MIIPSHYRITVDITSHTSNTSYRVQITRFTHYYIATWLNHSEPTTSGTTSGWTAAGIDFIFQTKLEHRNKTSNPPNRLSGSRTQTRNLSNNYQYDLYWTLAPTLCFVFTLVVVECKGRAKDLFMAVVFYASMSSFNNNTSSFNPSHPHIHPSHRTYFTTLTLSSRQGQLPLVPCLNGQSRKPTTNLGGRRRKDSSL